LIAASGGDAALAAAVARADGIVNLAGEPILGGRWNASRREAISRSRIQLTNSLVEAIERAAKRPDVLVSASAVGYYGDRSAEVVDENSAAGHDFLANVCREWEQAAQRAAQAGVRVFIPRFGVVLGLDGGALAQMLPPFQFGAGGPIGNGRQYIPWIHLFDLVELIATALEDPRYTGPAIAAAPNPVTSREFARALGRVLQRPSLVPVPAFALRVIFGDGASVLNTGQRVNPARLKELGFKWRFETLEPALRHILAEDDPAIESLDANSPSPANPANSGYLDQNPPRFVLRHAARVEAPLAQVFAFFSKPENLGVITPADMRFQIVGPVPDQMSQGTAIEYTMRVGPLPLHWRTQIETMQAQRLFIDSQQRGPYRCWWHEHYFQPDGNATTMEDRVYFTPPFGTLGAMASHAVVIPALRRIFRFRAQAMRLRFPGAVHRAAGGTTAS